MSTSRGRLKTTRSWRQGPRRTATMAATAASRRSARASAVGCALSRRPPPSFRPASPSPVCRRRHRATRVVPLPDRERVSLRTHGDCELAEPPVELVVHGARRGSGSTCTAACGQLVCSVAAPAATAASSAAPTPARDGPSRTSCVRPVTSLTICGHSAPRRRRRRCAQAAMVAPASSIVSRFWRTAKAAASMSARKRWPRPCATVSPTIAPRRSGSKSGVRSPAK